MIAICGFKRTYPIPPIFYFDYDVWFGVHLGVTRCMFLQMASILKLGDARFSDVLASNSLLRCWGFRWTRQRNSSHQLWCSRRRVWWIGGWSKPSVLLVFPNRQNPSPVLPLVIWKASRRLPPKPPQKWSLPLVNVTSTTWLRLWIYAGLPHFLSRFVAPIEIEKQIVLPPKILLTGVSYHRNHHIINKCKFVS